MKYVPESTMIIGSLIVGVLCSLSTVSAANGRRHLGLSHFITWNAKSFISEGLETFSRELSLTEKTRRAHHSKPASQAFFQTEEYDDDASLYLSMSNGALVLHIRGRSVIVPPDAWTESGINQAEAAPTIECENFATSVRRGDHLVFLHPLGGETMSSLRLQDWADFISQTQITVTSLRSFLQTLGHVSEQLAVVYAEVVDYDAIDTLPRPQAIKSLDLDSWEGQAKQWKGEHGRARKIAREEHRDARQKRVEKREEYLDKVLPSQDGKHELGRAQRSYRRQQESHRKEGRKTKEQFSTSDLSSGGP